VIGQTANSDSAKRPGRRWDESTFFADLEPKSGETAFGAARSLLEWARQEIGEPSWGSGATRGCFTVGFHHGGDRHVLFDVWSNGGVSIRFQRLKRVSAPFKEKAQRRALMEELNQIEGVRIPEPEGWPGFRLELLAPRQAMELFLGIMRGVAQRIRES
jgi:hypothetical protein